MSQTPSPAAPDHAENATESLLLILDAETIRRTIRRIAHEIIEQNEGPDLPVLVGIPTRGVEIASRLADHIESIEGRRPELGVIDVSMHRDDYHSRPLNSGIQTSTLPHPLEGRTLVLVDDVCYTGRTCRAALDAISSFGRPACIRLAALVDRGHRELPIRPDFIGKSLPTSRREKIRVRFAGLDSVPADAVWLVRPAEPAPQNDPAKSEKL